eukprot:TRINITY_DN8091_c0_g1_i1.p1 TRINITY_DN8091_c0_g1~~TRINITY_DN8091_c0_g1_i1.p1  ORF type:complete len:140 (-),score=33.07 TRINITY_DN8091_c0_g1_i1:224-643(-)
MGLHPILNKHPMSISPDKQEDKEVDSFSQDDKGDIKRERKRKSDAVDKIGYVLTDLGIKNNESLNALIRANSHKISEAMLESKENPAKLIKVLSADFFPKLPPKDPTINYAEQYAYLTIAAKVLQDQIESLKQEKKPFT